jgi:hypothetical protein
MTDKVLFQKVSQILNLVRRLGIGGGNTLPVVDFVVDRFDRTGVKGLGQYWDNRGAFSVVEGVGAVAMAGLYTAVEDYTTVGDVRTRLALILDEYYHYIQFNNVGMPAAHSGGQLARYRARMSSNNFTISVNFTVGPAVFGEMEGNDAIYRTPTQAFGIATSFDIDELGGLIFSTFASHQQLVGGSRIIDLTGLRSFISSSDGANIVLSVAGDYMRDHLYVTSSTTLPQLMVVGTNNMKFVISGDTAQAYLNNSLLFADSTGVFTKGRTVGLMAMAAVGLIAGSIGVTPPAITGFKAWVDGVSEPSDDESGHGVDDNGLNYTDGYHDEDGAYNPLTFEEES